MLVALLTDIHSNREAFEACLSHASDSGAERYVFLGDYVGYGADPNWVVDRVQDYVGKGAGAILGNHDAAISNLDERMSTIADIAIQWTRNKLGAAQKAFLQKLPLTIEEGDRFFVHASANAPNHWHYISSGTDARLSFDATGRRLTFCGHIHVPDVFRMTTTDKVVEFKPVSGSPIALSGMWRWLAIVGSVGQPRDGDPAAAYALFDEATNMLTYVRVPYDVETAARKVIKAGLPEVLGMRLLRGY